VEEGVAPVRTHHPDKSELKVLESDLMEKRRKGFAKASAAVESDRYRNIVLQTALWLLGGEWLTHKDALSATLRARPIIDFAPQELARRWDKIVKKIKKLDAMDTRQRHKMRIAIKKLRYARQFFDNLSDTFGSRKSLQRFDGALKELQTVLGKLNDMT